MNAAIHILAVHVIWIRRVRRAEAAVAAEHGGPAQRSRRPQRAVVLRTADDRAVRVYCAAIELRDGETVVQRRPATRQANGVDVVRTINAAIVSEKHRGIRRAVETGVVYDSVMVRMR